MYNQVSHVTEQRQQCCMQPFLTEIRTITAASPATRGLPVLAMACCTAWLNISGVMTLPPDDGADAEVVLEPEGWGGAENNPDDSNTPHLQMINNNN